MTREDAGWLRQEADKRNVKLLIMTNLVGHMEQFLHQERFHHMTMSSYHQLDFLRWPAEAENMAMAIADEFVTGFHLDRLHIGGDEVKLQQADIGMYASFLAKLCRNLLDKGITPCIWSDMLWMHPEFVDMFPRDVEIFDWNYYGHRPESLKFWKSKGFRKIYACPCENGWEGFINFQRVSGQLKAQLEPVVAPDEIEAFLHDASHEQVPNGLMTTWENNYGNALWAQLVPVARAALFMTGKWENNARNEESIEYALFGRITPYSLITKTVQLYIQEPLNRNRADIPPQTFRTAMYSRKALIRLLQRSSDLDNGVYSGYEQTEAEVKRALSEWEAADGVERNAYDAMVLTMANIDASCALVRASRAACRAYREAAAVQYTDVGACAARLEGARQCLGEVFPLFDKLAIALRAVQERTGHTRLDMVRLQGRTADIAKLQIGIEQLIAPATQHGLAMARPIPAWGKYVNYCLTSTPIKGYYDKGD